LKASSERNLEYPFCLEGPYTPFNLYEGSEGMGDLPASILPLLTQLLPRVQ